MSPATLPRCRTYDGRPDFFGFAKALREEADWEAMIKRGDTTGQADTDIKQLRSLARQAERAAQLQGFSVRTEPFHCCRTKDGRPDFGSFARVLREETGAQLRELADQAERVGRAQGYL